MKGSKLIRILTKPIVIAKICHSYIFLKYKKTFIFFFFSSKYDIEKKKKKFCILDVYFLCRGFGPAGCLSCWKTMAGTYIFNCRAERQEQEQEQEESGLGFHSSQEWLRHAAPAPAMFCFNYWPIHYPPPPPWPNRTMAAFACEHSIQDGGTRYPNGPRCQCNVHMHHVQFEIQCTCWFYKETCHEYLQRMRKVSAIWKKKYHRAWVNEKIQILYS